MPIRVVVASAFDDGETAPPTLNVRVRPRPEAEGLTLPRGEGAVLRTLSAPPGTAPPDASVSVDLELRHRDTLLTFGYDRIGPDDVISLTHVAPGRFLCSVAHSVPTMGCRARCADGTTGQPCVECRHGGTWIRVCC